MSFAFLPLINSRLTYFIIKITYPVKIAMTIKPITNAASDKSAVLVPFFRPLLLVWDVNDIADFLDSDTVSSQIGRI